MRNIIPLTEVYLHFASYHGGLTHINHSITNKPYSKYEVLMWAEESSAMHTTFYLPLCLCQLTLDHTLNRCYCHTLCSL